MFRLHEVGVVPSRQFSLIPLFVQCEILKVTVGPSL